MRLILYTCARFPVSLLAEERAVNGSMHLSFLRLGCRVSEWSKECYKVTVESVHSKVQLATHCPDTRTHIHKESQRGFTVITGNCKYSNTLLFSVDDAIT